MSNLLHKANDAAHKAGVALRLDNPDERDHAPGDHRRTHEELEREADAEMATQPQYIAQNTPGTAASRNLRDPNAYAPISAAAHPVHGIDGIPHAHEQSQTGLRPKNPAAELDLSEDRGTAGDDRAI